MNVQQRGRQQHGGNRGQKVRYCSECGSKLQDPRMCKFCGHVFQPDNLPKYEYELHPGQNKFFCKGRWIMASRQSIVSFTWVAFVVLYGVFLAFSAPYIWEHLTPALVVISAVLAIWAASNLLLTQLTDPGIVPRGEQQEIAIPGEELMG